MLAQLCAPAQETLQHTHATAHTWHCQAGNRCQLSSSETSHTRLTQAVQQFSGVAPSRLQTSASPHNLSLFPAHFEQNATTGSCCCVMLSAMPDVCAQQHNITVSSTQLNAGHPVRQSLGNPTTGTECRLLETPITLRCIDSVCPVWPWATLEVKQHKSHQDGCSDDTGSMP